MKTHIATPEDIKGTHQFYVIDAEGVILGRLATRVATLLMGKHKPIYTPFLDTGDHVIIVNADKIRLTGEKMDKKKVIYHTMHPGGLKQKTFRKALADQPQKVLQEAIWGMLPKNRLGRKMLKKLRVYSGPEHPHAAHKPVPLTIE
ncbi:MAG TPA: 50S ribosomal protein L13 [bacterium]|nr:50S ribosomal protein L13 [bacterium]